MRAPAGKIKDMNNFVIISRTYAETTPESSEEGDFSDHGFLTEREEVTFRELVKLMKDHPYASQAPNPLSIDVWYSTDFFTADYARGIEREHSIHFHGDNTPNAAKYWRYARLAADKKHNRAN